MAMRFWRKRNSVRPLERILNIVYDEVSRYSFRGLSHAEQDELLYLATDIEKIIMNCRSGASQQKEYCGLCGQVLPEQDFSGIDVAEASRVAGVTERQVYRWKSGECRPNPKALKKLQQAGLV